MLGRSKMRVFKTIAGQLGLLRKLIVIRMTSSPVPAPVPPSLQPIPSPVPTPGANS
jgi:hypothetical protein